MHANFVNHRRRISDAFCILQALVCLNTADFGTVKLMLQSHFLKHLLCHDAISMPSKMLLIRAESSKIEVVRSLICTYWAHNDYRGIWGHAPSQCFWNLDALKSLLRPFLDQNSSQTTDIRISMNIYFPAHAPYGFMGMSDFPFQWSPSQSSLSSNKSQSFYPRGQWLPVFVPYRSVTPSLSTLEVSDSQSFYPRLPVFLP